MEHERWGTPVASYVAGLPPDARPLDRGKPRDEDTEGGSQPADKSLINRRLSLHSQPCAAMAFLADGEFAEQALNRASPLDREHKRLATPCCQRCLRKLKTGLAASWHQAVGEREDKYGKTTLGRTHQCPSNLRLQPKTASSLLPSVHKGDL